MIHTVMLPTLSCTPYDPQWETRNHFIKRDPCIMELHMLLAAATSCTHRAIRGCRSRFSGETCFSHVNDPGHYKSLSVPDPIRAHKLQSWAFSLQEATRKDSVNLRNILRLALSCVSSYANCACKGEADFQFVSRVERRFQADREDWNMQSDFQEP